MLLLAALGVLLCGIAIGATSIGGVMVVPVLTTLAAVTPTQAVAAASFGFAFPAVAAYAGARREGSGHHALDIGALCGAALGALTLTWLPGAGVRLAVGLLAIGSGLYALLGRQPGGSERRLGIAALSLLGAAVGCASAWSGTGGPVVLLPLLALLGWPAVAAVAVAQRIQLPVALAATAVNFAAGRLDLQLGAVIGVLVLAGWWLGRAVARRLPVRRLQQLVALALIATGLAYL